MITENMHEIRDTDEGITGNEVPDPDVLPDVAGYFVLVRPVKTHTEKTKGGIILTAKTQEDVKYLCNVGKVLKVGPLAYKNKDGSDSGWWPDGPLKEGDYVQFERFSGKRFRYKGVNLVLLKDVALNFRIKDPIDVDPMTSIGDNT